MEKTNQSITAKLTESAIMLALMLVLSYIKLLDLPYGGSITACSMLPVILIAYRHGTGWGLLTAFVSGLLQLLMGAGALAYATSTAAAIAIVLLDFLAAFTMLGLAGVFKKLLHNQTAALAAGTLLACFLRYGCHVIAGCTVWMGISIPDSQALLYSLAYNATYMLPETLITLLGAVYISRAVDLQGKTPHRLSGKTGGRAAVVLDFIAATAALSTLVTDIVLVASKLQDAETGGFAITGLTQVNYTAVGIVSACGVVLTIIFLYAAKNNRAAKQ